MGQFPPTTEELLDTFKLLDEWDERYDYIIDLGRELPDLATELKTEDRLVSGCMSTVWMDTQVTAPDQPVTIQADSDSLIVKGLIAILLAFYQTKPATAVVQEDPEAFLTQLGLNQHLSPQRRNGLFAMIKRLKQNVTAAIS